MHGRGIARLLDGGLLTVGLGWLATDSGREIARSSGARTERMVVDCGDWTVDGRADGGRTDYGQWVKDGGPQKEDRMDRGRCSGWDHRRRTARTVDYGPWTMYERTGCGLHGRWTKEGVGGGW